ncbi:hypothetical protein EON65_02115 [archaeon]|nr:MAG: hypothetical protein EON65_02115 [archaeon]
MNNNAKASAGAKDTANAEGNSTLSASNKFISPKTFYPVPHHGKVECDFVNIHRPHVLYCRAASDEKVLDVSTGSIILAP